MRFIEKYDPVVLAISCLFVCLGMLGVVKLPNALLPHMDRPQIALLTTWPGHSATEIQQALIAPLERQLGGITHLKDFQSNIGQGQAWTTLNFHDLVDMQKTYMEVLARVNRVAEWPAEVPRPRVIDYSGGAGSTLTSLFLYSEQQVPDEAFRAAYNAHIEPALMKIPGVAQINLDNNPMSQRVDIEFDPQKLAKFSLTIDGVTRQLQGLVDRSGDSIRLGSKDYLLEFKGQVGLRKLLDVPLATYAARMVRLSDVATIKKRFVYDWTYSAFNGNQAIYFYIQPNGDINVLATIEQIKQTIRELNTGPLGEAKLTLAMSRDNSIPIKDAIALVYGSLALGIVFAGLFLLLFIGRLAVVSIIMLSIPVCLSLVVIAMQVGGLSINLISLAGMALSVGLLLDASIIVVESIQQRRDAGASLIESCRQGVSQVRAALISSTLSSVVIFAPVLMMQSTAGQLFEDLAFTLSSALIVSLVVALFLLPVLCRYFMGQAQKVTQTRPHSPGKLGRWSERLSAPARLPSLAHMCLFVGLPVAIAVAWFCRPPLDMLPNPKENIVMVYSRFDESLSVSAATERVAEPIEARIKKAEQQGTAPAFDIHGMFCSTNYCLLYFYPEGDWQFDEFQQWISSEVTNDLADVSTFIYQGSLLRLALPNARTTQLDLKGADTDVLKRHGQQLVRHLTEEFKGARITPVVPINDTAASIQFTPDADKLAYLNLSGADLNQQLVALTDGRYLGQFYTEGDSLPFFLRGKDFSHLDTLLETEIVRGTGRPIVLRDVVDVNFISAPSALYRSSGDSAVGLNLDPPAGQPVGEFMGQVADSVEQFLAQTGGSGIFVNYRGSGDELALFLHEFVQMFLISFAILFVLMRITLHSWRMASAVMLSLPLAFMGGTLLLNLVNQFVPQNLDIVTMIGFIILMGLVINNAILLVSQYQLQLRQGDQQYQAIITAIQRRARPIYMSTGTSILGMLPLMLNPGDGAEVYRGLASVIVGGMLASSLFTLSFMSALLSLKVFNKNQALATAYTVYTGHP